MDTYRFWMRVRMCVYGVWTLLIVYDLLIAHRPFFALTLAVVLLITAGLERLSLQRMMRDVEKLRDVARETREAG